MGWDGMGWGGRKGREGGEAILSNPIRHLVPSVRVQLIRKGRCLIAVDTRRWIVPTPSVRWHPRESTNRRLRYFIRPPFGSHMPPHHTAMDHSIHPL